MRKVRVSRNCRLCIFSIIGYLLSFCLVGAKAQLNSTATPIPTSTSTTPLFTIDTSRDATGTISSSAVTELTSDGGARTSPEISNLTSSSVSISTTTNNPTIVMKPSEAEIRRVLTYYAHELSCDLNGEKCFAYLTCQAAGDCGLQSSGVPITGDSNHWPVASIVTLTLLGVILVASVIANIIQAQKLRKLQAEPNEVENVPTTLPNENNNNGREISQSQAAEQTVVPPSSEVVYENIHSKKVGNQTPSTRSKKPNAKRTAKDSLQGHDHKVSLEDEEIPMSPREDSQPPRRRKPRQLTPENSVASMNESELSGYVQPNAVNKPHIPEAGEDESEYTGPSESAVYEDVLPS